MGETEMSVMGKDFSRFGQEKGFEIRTFMPKWGHINERRGQLHEVIRLSGMNIIINDTDHPLIIKVASIPASRVQAYFIDNDDFFTKRLMGRDKEGREYDDNGERAIFYARGVLETVKKLRWMPDIIHCQGWMSAIVPLYLKTAYRDEPPFAGTKVVMSLFKSDLEQSFAPDFKQCIEFRDADKKALAPYPDVMTPEDLYKLAIDYSDAVIEGGSQVDQGLLAYAEAKSKPVLRNPGADFIGAYKEFFNQL